MKEKEVYIKKMISKIFKWLSFLYVAVAILVAMYYIVFQMAYFIHADYTDTLLWAQASYEAGRLLNPDFIYAAVIPFGGNIIMLPGFMLFGFSLKAQIFGMALFAILFMLAFWFFLSK